MVQLPMHRLCLKLRHSYCMQGPRCLPGAGRTVVRAQAAALHGVYKICESNWLLCIQLLPDAQWDR